MESALLYFILMFLTIPSASSKKYHIPQGWNVKNNDKLEQLETAQESRHYRLIRAPQGAYFLSDNGTYGLCFFSFNGTESYYLSLVMGTVYRTNSSTSGVIVWTGNRNSPIPENGTLSLGYNGALELSSPNGALIWRSDATNISEIELLESGKVAFYGKDRKVVWESFNETSDVLLEGQKLRYGQMLTSNTNTSSMATGNFQVKIELNGVTFSVIFPTDRVSETYYQWNLWNQGTVSCPTSRPVVQFNRSRFNMFYEGGTLTCGPPMSVALAGSPGSLNFLKLDVNGNLLQFSFDPQELVWNRYSTAISNLIGACLPLKCAAHTLCKADGQCECLTSKKKNICLAPTEHPLPCNKLEERNHHFLNVSGASYFTNKYTREDKVSTLEDCWSICLANCSCHAFSYTSTGSCYFMSTVRGSLTADSSSSTFLKVQNVELLYPKDHKESMVLFSTVGGATFFILTCIGLVALWLWRKHASKIAATLAEALQGSIRRYSYKELKSATSSFSTVIGSGGSGTVYSGVLADGMNVAVKKLNSTNQGQKEFVAEVNSIGSISHMNIVKLCGFCAEKSYRVLVYEFAANGSLDKWLFDKRHGESFLDWKTRWNVALGVARALAYLHEESVQLIMHLDIKPQNILLDEHFIPKLCDFGMSKLFANRDLSQATTYVRGTPGYLAPEWLLHSVATRKCDVYSYGMVLFELISGRRNLDARSSSTANETEDEGLSWYFPAWVVNKMRKGGNACDFLDKRLSEDVDEHDVVRMIRVALWCIQENPVSRPSMDNVVQMLEGHKEVPDPPLAFHFALESPGIISISTTTSSVSFTRNSPTPCL